MPADVAAAARRSPASAQRASLYDLRSHARIWPVAVIGLAVDLWSKDLAFRHLSADQPVVLIPHVLSLRKVVNPGAMLGLGQGLGLLFMVASILALLFVVYLFAHSDPSRRSLHVGLGLVLAGALGNLYDRTFHVADAVWGPPPETVRLLKGDRILLCGKLIRENTNTWVLGDYPDGENPQTVPKSAGRHVRPTPVVRDFIKVDVKIGSFELWRWVFNVADSLLVVGVGLLLINFWTEQRKTGKRALSATQAPCEAQSVSGDESST
ncbi:MAG: signal peptidase II [Phycisphaerales bacterium]|nr:MAG: signal peptidase II [Phycisphaerales bacterium]